MQQVAHYLRPPADAWTPALRARVVRAHLFGRPRRPLRRFCGARGGLSERAVARRRPAPIEPRRPPRGPRIGTRSQRDLRSDGRKFVVFFPPPFQPASARPPRPPRPPLCVVATLRRGFWRLFGGALATLRGRSCSFFPPASTDPRRTPICLPARRFFSHPPRYRCPTSCSPFACTIWHWWL